MVYLIDTVPLVAKFRRHLNIALRDFPLIKARTSRELSNWQLHETVVRLAWNTFNEDCKFKWELWDEDNSISKWYRNYTLDPIDVNFDSEIIYDDPSIELYQEVIDPFVIELRDYLKRLRIRRDWKWEVFDCIEVRSSSILVKSLGDFRIADYERLKSTYESDTNDVHPSH